MTKRSELQAYPFHLWFVFFCLEHFGQEILQVFRNYRVYNIVTDDMRVATLKPPTAKDNERVFVVITRTWEPEKV